LVFPPDAIRQFREEFRPSEIEFRQFLGAPFYLAYAPPGDPDAYYYGKDGDRRLPVLRVTFNDPDATILYLDAHDGQLVQREVRRSRLERWLYHGFHSLDFPWMYRHGGCGTR